MNRNRHTRATLAALTALAILAPLAPQAAAQPADEICRGPKDDIELDLTAIRVIAAKRETFLAVIRAYAAGKSMRVGTANDYKGWFVLILETRPAGVTIEVEATDADTFRAVIRTCNATQDWRPHWTAFKLFIDMNRAVWSA